MAQLRFAAQPLSYVPVTSPDAVEPDGSNDSELLAVSETAAIGQASALVLEVDEDDWMATDDYDAAGSDSDRDDALTTSDIDGRLVADAEKADARRGSVGRPAQPAREEPALLAVDTDIDSQLYLADLENIVAGVKPQHSLPEAAVDAKLAGLEERQSLRNGRNWLRG